MKKGAALGIIAFSVVAATGLLWFGVQKTMASEKNNQTIVERLAQKLGIDQSQVKNAFDEIKKENKINREEEQNKNLEQAVKDGVITEEQKNQIISKLKELSEKRRQIRRELQDWGESQGINWSELRGYGIGGIGRHKEESST